MKRLLSLAAAAALTVAAASPALADLAPGAKAPDFTAQAFRGGQPLTFKLSEALKKGPVVIYFFPAAYTGGCNIETHMFSDSIDQFTALKATVIGVTTGNVDKLADFSKDTQYCAGKFTLAADPDHKIATAYDTHLSLVGVKLPPGTNLPADLSNRTSYVLAPSGKILLAYTKGDPTDHVNQTLTAVKAYRESNQ
jgi:peroxiredoxin Q/BCP